MIHTNPRPRPLNDHIAGDLDAGKLPAVIADAHAIYVELLGAVGDAIALLR